MTDAGDCLKEALGLSREEKVQKILEALRENPVVPENLDARVRLIYEDLSFIKDAEGRRAFLRNIYHHGVASEDLIGRLSREELRFLGAFDFDEEDETVPDDEINQEDYISTTAKKLLGIPGAGELPQLSAEERAKMLTLVYANYVHDDGNNHGKLSGLAGLFAREGMGDEAVQYLVHSELGKLFYEVSSNTEEDLDAAISPEIREKILRVLRGMDRQDLFY